MVIKYEAAVQPIKLLCNALKAGNSYVVVYERRNSVEFASHPQLSTRPGEVTYSRITDPISVPTFGLNFESTKDKKLLSFSVYDFTQRPKIEQLLEFDIPLGDYVDVGAGESFCTVKDFPFKSGKHSGTMRVMLRMHPVGTAVPTAVATQPSGVLKGETIAVLQREKLVPANVSQIEADVDVLEEIAAKIVLLEKNSEMKRKTSPEMQQLWQKKAELEALLTELEAADKLDGGVSQLDVADRQVIQLLNEEEQLWKKAADALPSSTTAQPSGPVAISAEDAALVKELEKQKGTIQKRLQHLEGEQSVRDVTTEAIELLEQSKHLEALIEETKAHHQQSKTGRSSRIVKFKDDDESPEGLARRLLAAHAEAECMEYQARVLEQLRNRPYDGVKGQLEEHEKLPLPRELSGVLRNTRRPTGRATTAATVATAPPSSETFRPSVATVNSTKDLLEDLFSDGSSSAKPLVGRVTSAPVSRPVAATAKPSAPPSGLLDDLFGGPSAAAPPPAQSRPPAVAAAPVVSQPVVAPAVHQTAPVGSSPQAPRYDRLPLATTTEFTSFFSNPFLLLRCHALRFVNEANGSVRYLRGSELIFQNGGMDSVVVSDVVVKQEDLFSNAVTIIPSKANANQMLIAPGEFGTLLLSYSPETSVSNALMVLLTVNVVKNGTASPDSIRVTL